MLRKKCKTRGKKVCFQDKLSQVKDARAALDALREEERERRRREAEEAERQRQLQMAHKLDLMRKKKAEYLEYQRQVLISIPLLTQCYDAILCFDARQPFYV